MTARKKLIEVALPLDAINAESAREKSVPRMGHPATMHLWWARRPLAACRAVLFASLIDDPGQEGVPQALLEAIDALPAPPDALPGDNPASLRRKRLFAFIGELVKWENTTNEQVLGIARELIRAATGGKPPPVLDPFCGGGSIPLEAQRLGLEVYASDLNPVAVLITKALVEIPPKFAGRPPVNPEYRGGTLRQAQGERDTTWKGAAGLAADVRWYGRWMRDRAFERIGHLYPKSPKGETIIAWLWARTVKCPNPACGAQMPLVRSFWLSTKKDREAWVEPIIDRSVRVVRFEARSGTPAPGRRDAIALGSGLQDPEQPDKKVRAAFRCLVCGQIADGDHTKADGMAGLMGQQLMAIVAEGTRARSYLSPDERTVPALTPEEDAVVGGAREGFLSGATPKRLTGGTCYGYGLTTWGALFTPRQLVALAAFSDLVGEARALALEHARQAGLSDDGVGIAQGGAGATAYADAVATYLAFAVDKLADWSSSLCSWIHSIEGVRDTFARQALPMVWDFVEINPLSESVGNILNHVTWTASAVEAAPAAWPAFSAQLDASAALGPVVAPMVFTDPPYYDNIGYADLSDFFYIWLRRTLGRVYPDLFATVLTPKGPELVATAYRFNGSKAAAEQHFEKGLLKAFTLLRQTASWEYPVSFIYAFKQRQEGSGGGIASTAWETMLSGLLGAGFQATATWPMRTERGARMISIGTNALASAVVLACRPRADDAPMATRRELVAALRAELPGALRHLVGGHIAPVDLAQAAIGPGMAVFSRYSRVLEPDGSAMTVRRALELINQALEDYFTETEGELDPGSQFCVRWFEQHGTQPGRYGEADVLARAKGIGVEALGRDGLLESRAGNVRLQPLARYLERAAEYDPATDRRPTAWEACHYLVAALQTGGVTQAGPLARRLGGLAGNALQLAYRLYAICERKGWSEEALGYNILADSWPAIQEEAARSAREAQGGLL